MTAGGVALNGTLEDGFDFGTFDGGQADQIGGELGEEEDPATRLRRLIEQRQTESIEILRGWMEHEEEPV